MTAHTAGPWQITGRYGQDKLEITNGSRHVAAVRAYDFKRDKNGKAAFTGDRPEVEVSEGFANARLIVKAPALLELLERIVVTFDRDGIVDLGVLAAARDTVKEAK